MRWKLVDGAQLSGESSTYVVALDIGDEAVASLTTMAKEHELSNAQITAVGAFQKAVVGWFDRESRSYRRIPVQEQCEVLSLIGDIVGSDSGPQLHLHAVLGLSDGSTRGGHLLEGTVWPTLEVVIRESPAGLRKTNRPEIGLALIDIDRSS
ncbi:MAG: PPC domain-containing DNA-binding protein [Microbacteriaceae bacterium]